MRARIVTREEMIMRIPSFLSLAGAAALLIAFGCASSRDLAANATDPASAPTPDAAVSVRPAMTMPTITVGEGATRPTISPMNERERSRRAVFAAATEGVRFDADRVVVETPLVGDAPAFNAAGWAALELGDRDDAIASFVKAVRSAPDDADGYAGLAEALARKSKMDLALAAYRSAIDLRPDDRDLRYDYAQRLSWSNDRAGAAREMRAALTIDPTFGPAHERLAIWSYYDGDYAAAWRHVHAAEAGGKPVPPQFVQLLSAQMPDPAG
jgi:tetratricopeptide (TPR) repeat protein